MKYKPTKEYLVFIPENKKDSYFLGATFNESTQNLYSLNFINGELESVSIKFEDILFMIGNKKNE